MTVNLRASQKSGLAGYLLSLLLLTGVTLVLWQLRDVLTLANFSLLYILPILGVAVWLGLGPALLSAITSFFGFNFFLIRPYYTLTVEDPRELLDLIVFLLVAVVASQLAAYGRRQAAAARLRAAEQEVLYNLSSALNQFTDAAEVLAELKRVVWQAVGPEAVEVLPGVNQPPAGNRDRQTTAFLLLSAGEKVYGTLAVQLGAPPAEAQSRLLMACAVQTAMALQRIELAGRAQRSRMLEEADQLKTAILQAVSHDLRTPITIIKTSASNLHQLHDGLSPEAKREMAEVIEAEADHLDRLVGNLLDMSRLQAGALPLYRQRNALVDIVGDVAARAWQLYKAERVRLDFPADMPLVCCDYGLLLRALSNISENALRFEPTGSQVVLRGAVGESSTGTAEARVLIINHGPSIPAEEKPRLMEPFYRRRDGSSRGGQAGLGLAIAQGIIEAHQGRIWVEDTPGGGATFVVALPLAEGEEQQDAAHSDR